MARKSSGGATKGLTLGGISRVNLLPPAVVEHRLRAALTRRWIVGLVVTVVFTALSVAASQAVVATSQAALQQEQDRTLQLTTELGSYADITNALAKRDALTDYRSQAMGNHFAWQPVFSAIEGRLPAGVTLKGFQLTTGGNPVAKADQPRAVGLTGTLSLSSKDPIDQHTVVSQLRALDIVIGADAGDLRQSGTQNGGYDMTVVLSLDQTIYSGAYGEGGPR